MPPRRSAAARPAGPRGEWVRRCIAGAQQQFDAPPARAVGRLAYAVNGRVHIGAVPTTEIAPPEPISQVKMIGQTVAGWIAGHRDLTDAGSEPVQVVLTCRPRAPRSRDPVRLVLVPQAEREIYGVRAYWRLWISGPWWALSTPEGREREINKALAWGSWDGNDARVSRPRAPIPTGRLVPAGEDDVIDGQRLLFNREETP